jgi:HSP20 family molecular chaperone IbpA
LLLFVTAFQRLRIAVLNPVDLYETETAFVLEADLPGVKPEEVSVRVEGDELGRLI